MPAYPFMQIDAFSDQPLGGNPCAVLFDTDEMSDETMQAVALEMNLSETAFVRKSAVADFGARYFTPAEEIPLAGHPTIATVFGLVATGRLPLDGDRTRISLELKAGVIAVDVLASGGKVDRIVMTQRPPRFLRKYDPAVVLPVFGLDQADALPGVPVQTVFTGTPGLMVPVADHAALRRAALDIPAYEALKAEGDFFSPHLFCLRGATSAGDTFARHFGSPPDTLEDPFTGSATGCMAAYLWRYGLIEAPAFRAEQGHWMGRPGIARVEIDGPREAPEAIRVGGQAALVVEGRLTL